MPRAPNPYYAPADPMASIGASLGRALFGDPAAREKLAEAQSIAEARRAQAAESTAHAGLYTSQTTGQDTQNRGAMGLPDLLAAYAKSFQPPAVADPTAPLATAPGPVGAPPVTMGAPIPASPGDAAAPADIVVTARHPVQPDGSALAALLAAGGQAQGDKVNPEKLAAMMAAMMGSDSDARRAMIGGYGNTPGKDFALTPQRADDIAANLSDAELARGVATANANHASDIPVANIHAGATLGAAQIGAGASVQGAQIGANARRDVAGIEVRGRADAAGAGGKAAKPISADNMGMLEKELNASILARGYGIGQGTDKPVVGPKGFLTPRAIMAVRSRAVANYRETGDPVAAVTAAFKQAAAAGGAAPQRAPAPRALPSGARPAPDGNYYVPDPKRPGKYLRVDG